MLVTVPGNIFKYTSSKTGRRVVCLQEKLTYIGHGGKECGEILAVNFALQGTNLWVSVAIKCH